MRRFNACLWRRAAMGACLCMVVGLSAAAGQGRDAASGPISAAAFAAKKQAALSYIRSLEPAHKTLSGVQVNEFEVYLDCDSADRLEQTTGHRPAILGLELMNAIAVAPYGDYVFDRAVRQSQSGGLVTLTWHERNPVEVCIRGEYFDCTQKPMSEDTLKAVLTPGSKANTLWLADVDAIAVQLKRLREAGVVVLFRPYHEMNGGWFWWGKKDGYPQLWDALYDRLVQYHHLDNLIWVWGSDRDTPDAARYVPVRHKPDVAGIDVYETDRFSPKYAAGRKNLSDVFGARMPFAVTEVGVLPEKPVLDAINPAWVLLWGGEYLNRDLVMRDPCPNCNAAGNIAAFMAYDRTVSLDGLPPALRKVLADAVHNDTPLPRKAAVCPVKLL